MLLLAMMAAGTACTAEEEPAPAPEEPSEPPSPEEAAEQSALEAYEGMWEIVVEASHDGNPDPDELENYASGDALALMRHGLESAEDDGAFEGEPDLNPEVVEREPQENPETVELIDCADGAEWTGSESSPSDDASAGTRQIDATVTDDGLAWRVSELRIWEQGSC
ncbi:hypothetical protein IDM40_00505 [Nocardiopsis sp. HNM0947]|uniref:Secreted protein n=1 Tax=Nocardiopsis coralli TaxID=2772213 RepID=A0ABR9P032_9ACTN|nr:hypothetical protein [Nocardiopsis coralli]MBE2997186.1 hypothetical protein [Nocardiopsis coralli]